MEDRATYNVQADAPYIRAESLRAFVSWTPPDAPQVRAVMAKAGLEPRELAEFVGVSRKEVNRWTTAGADVPFACWVLLCRRAGIGYADF